jgi:16S rRNA (adenine1518-N6/adenine1519-N6)-dimethyltransferase
VTDDPSDADMRPGTLSLIRDELKSRGLRLTKKRGQNFMIDPAIARAVAHTAGVHSGGIAFEVGPGAGHLTREVLALGARVVAVEIDRGLAAYLRDVMGGEIAEGRLRLVEADVLGGEDRLAPAATEALKDELARSGARSFVVAANLPYNIAATFLIALAGSSLPWSGGAVVIQREVADRLAADPGSKTYGASTVMWSLLARGRVERRIGREVFWPRPDVDSALMVIEPREDVPDDLVSESGAFSDFGDFVRALFSQRRKVLRTSVAHAARGWVGGYVDEAKALAAHALSAAGVDPSTRIERVAPERILALWRAAREGR